MHSEQLTTLLSVLLICAGHRMASAQTIWYVDGSVTTSGDGTTWATATKMVQEGIDAATPNNDPPDQVWIAAGVYKPMTTTATFELEAGVRVYGGFLGTEDAIPISDTQDPREFDPETDLPVNETILSGELGNPSLHTDNVEVVVTGPTDFVNNDDFVLDGFTITRAGGHGVYVPPPQRNGEFRNLKIIDNRAVEFAGDGFPFGAGMFLDNSDSLIANCKFIDNYLDANGGGEGGGAGLALFASDATIDDCMFDSNTALSTESQIQGGGGAYSSGGLPVFRRCDFKNNTVKDALGGGLYLFSVASTSEPEPEDFAYVAGCTFTDNTAETLGDQQNILVGGGGAWSLHQTQYLSCTFRRNRVIDIDGDPFIPDDDNLPFGIGGGATPQPTAIS